MELWLANAVTFLYLAVAWFGLIDGVTRWAGRRRGIPIGWTALVVLPLALSYDAIRPLFFAAACVAALGYHLLRRRLKHQDDPETLLLFFCSYGSVAASGAIAGLTIALFLFAASLLDGWSLWQPVQIVHLLWVSAAWGAAYGIARKAIRRRWPEPLGAGYVPRFNPEVATARGAAISAPFGTGGFWVDELLLALVGTPFLWGTLSSIHPMWHLIFLYGWLFLPALVIYMFWAAVHTAWLRWTGSVDPTERSLFAAYEALMTDDYVQRWLGEISLDYDPGAHRFAVTGTVPSSAVLATIRTRLKAIGEAAVDVSHVRVDPTLMPNARLELALSKRRGRLGR